MVPIADLLKSRYKLRLQDTSQITLAWRPFGFLPKEKIEVGLWPWLEDAHNRTYLYWVWWIEEDGAMTKDIQHGFRRDTGRFLSDVPGTSILRLQTVSGLSRHAYCSSTCVLHQVGGHFSGVCLFRARVLTHLFRGSSDRAEVFGDEYGCIHDVLRCA